MNIVNIIPAKHQHVSIVWFLFGFIWRLHLERNFNRPFFPTIFVLKFKLFLFFPQRIVHVYFEWPKKPLRASPLCWTVQPWSLPLQYVRSPSSSRRGTGVWSGPEGRAPSGSWPYCGSGIYPPQTSPCRSALPTGAPPPSDTCGSLADT